MSDHDNDNELNVRAISLEELNEIATRSVVDSLMRVGVPEGIAKVFVCLRFHLEHTWGMTSITVNGKKSAAIITPHNDDGSEARVQFIIPTEDMKIVGNSGEEAVNGILKVTKNTETIN